MIALLLAPDAAAWSDEREVWAADDVPVPVLWSGLPDGMERAEVIEALDGARAAWAEASCGRFDVTFIEQDDEVDRARDGANALVFGDPHGGLAPGVVSEVYPQAGDESVTIDGTRYDALEESDLVLAALAYAPDAGIDASCAETWSFQAVLTHAIGQLAGLGPSCDSTYECGAPGLDEATMYAPLPACDTAASTLEDDDRLGIRWLYGNTFRTWCGADAADPMGATCTVDAPEGGSARWDFGDGASAEGASVSHAYAEAGAYVVTACTDVEGCDTPSCERHVVWAVAPGTVTGTAPEDEEEAGGCASAPAPSGGLLATLLAGLAARGRRRSG